MEYEASSAGLEKVPILLHRRYRMHYEYPSGDHPSMGLSGPVKISLERTEVKMTTVCLELHAYSDVLSWARSLVGNGEYLKSRYAYYRVDRREDLTNAYYAKAYYNKALAYEAIGILNQAMPAILNAAEYNAEDLAISSQLAVLKEAHKEMKERKKATKRAKRAAKDDKVRATAEDAANIFISS